MSTGKIILVVLATVVIFATGVVTGGMLVRFSVRTPVTAPPPAAFHRFDLARRAASQMDLSPEQRVRIERVIRENQDRIADYLQILEPEIADAFRQMRESIRAELTPDQRKKFDDRMLQLRRINERRGNRSNLLDNSRPAGPRGPVSQNPTSSLAPTPSTN